MLQVYGAIVKHEGQMTAITSQVIKTQAGLDKVAVKTEKLDNRVNLVETDINIIKEWQVYIDDTLLKANVLAEVETKEKFESLEKEHGVELYEYAIKFYGTLTNVLLAYRMISTGVIKEKKDYSNEIVKKISKALGLGDKFSPPLIIAEKIMPVVNDFYEKYAGKCKVDPRVIFDNISVPLLERDLNLAIASSAIKIAIAKKQILKAEETKEPVQIGGVKKWFSDTFNKQEVKTSKNSIPESQASKMAAEDVALFIINSIAQSKFGQNSQEAQKLMPKIEELFKDDTETKQLLTELYNKTHPQEATKTVVVNVVDEIIYDNPLLNDFKLMEKAAKLFGCDKALNLSKELSQDLIKEAIKNDDHDIILGGLLSLVGEINISE
ncbi:hypothetical protein [Candidatus Tisiphia endosymbiont of Mystacides longicornis]|uniref:hypothetical protein n=1 Tax=Candidatus Tisiphia endosymbiont of Mystacides longicornis TaxID=3139330 RepID=UPI003CCB3566